jgi:hypothetical protein
MLDRNPGAFLIVMNVIHGQCQQILIEVDAVMLQKVTNIIRYRNC